MIAAEILKMNPEIKGTFGTSWYYDPRVGEISPKLAYIRGMRKQFGGNFFYMGPSEHCTYHATYKFPTRRKLFREGKYLSKDYLLVVPRKILIQAAGG